VHNKNWWWGTQPCAVPKACIMFNSEVGKTGVRFNYGSPIQG